MKIVIEFDYGWFWFSFTDFLFPVTKMEKSLYREGKPSHYWRHRRWQLFAWLFLPVTFIASFADSFSIKTERGI